MKFTQWFDPLKKQFPHHIGVYQRTWDNRITYSYWTGYSWSYSGFTVEEAIQERHSCSYKQNALWRGIAK